jgi:hypothetical protein
MAIGARSSSIYPAGYAVPVGYGEPLLGHHDEEVASRPPDVVKAAPLQNGAEDGNASFVQTCLNGLNALSGYFPAACSEFRSNSIGFAIRTLIHGEIDVYCLNS